MKAYVYLSLISMSAVFLYLSLALYGCGDGLDLGSSNSNPNLTTDLIPDPADPTGAGSTSVFSCPTHYISVPGNTIYDTNGFCIMKYEAKLMYDDIIIGDGNINNEAIYDFNAKFGGVDEAKFKAISNKAGRPWVRITRGINASTSSSQGAIEACKNLGESYNLITNAQWQTIARNIEAQTTGDTNNWGVDENGDTILNHGHGDGDPNQSCDVFQESVEGSCSNSNNETDFAEKRTHTLSNGEVIWDMAGNVREWVKDNNTDLVNGGVTAHWSEASFLSTTQLTFGPLTLVPASCSNPSGGIRCGLGKLTDNSTGAVLRGGDYQSPLRAGVFGVYLGFGPNLKSGIVGFRCVYHPPE